jgi:hypothetical protein
MKQSKLWIGCLLLLWGAASCENALPLYETPDCRLNFVYIKPSDGTSAFNASDITAAMRENSYSFVYAGSDVEIDTIWFQVTTMGFLSDQDRPIALMQIMAYAADTVDATAIHAVADEHYVAFDNPEMASWYKIPAGAAEARIPIVMKRAASLADGDVTLKFTFKENAYFKPGYAHLIERTLLISSKLAKPDNWESSYANYMFGTYGPVKHQFLIDISGNPWDAAYVDELMNGDSEYVYYLQGLYAEKLAELNAERAASGLDPLSEADGTPVEI